MQKCVEYVSDSDYAEEEGVANRHRLKGTYVP